MSAQEAFLDLPPQPELDAFFFFFFFSVPAFLKNHSTYTESIELCIGLTLKV